MYQEVQHSKIVHSAHSVFICFVFISEQTVTFVLHDIKWLVFRTEMKSAYCAVRTVFFSPNKRVYASSLKDYNSSGTFTVNSQYEILSLSVKIISETKLLYRTACSTSSLCVHFCISFSWHLDTSWRYQIRINAIIDAKSGGFAPSETL
jgi:hypothetical protein